MEIFQVGKGKVSNFKIKYWAATEKTEMHDGVHNKCINIV